ncbi:hypothetical protein OG689_27565 [Kitasatospora sp. NBC_00240]|nr:hypothetical protein [Kitasatospora sp. NBC_00240]MCX5212982.1 hypothetical protein [Kitasatospora sp. NBC_00240]
MLENREPHPDPARTDQYGQRLPSPTPDPQHVLDRLGRGAQPQQPEPGRG